jgi:hypothetical protein
MSASRNCEPLELADRLAELLALAGVGDGVVQGGLREADGARGDAEPSAVERRQGDPEPLALLAQPVAGRHADALEQHLGRRRGGHPHLALGGRRLEAGGVRRHEEGGDAPRVLCSPVRAMTT